MAKDEVKAESKGRRKRVPFGGHRTKLQIENDIPGFHLRWFNDQDERLARAVAGGYEFVSQDEVPLLGQGALHQGNTDIGAKVSKVVSRGDPVIRAYLMKIKQKYYDEDQAAKQVRNEQIDEDARTGKPGGNVVENQYVPKGHVQNI